MAIRTCLDLGRPLIVPVSLTKSPSRNCKFSVQSCSLSSNQSHKQLIVEVKEKLGRDYHSLPVGKNGRDDEEMILWFLKDRRFSVDEAISKLTKAISKVYCIFKGFEFAAIEWFDTWKCGSESIKLPKSVKKIADTGKAYVHDSLDVSGKPVLIVVASKHFPSIPGQGQLSSSYVTIDFSWFDEGFMEHDSVENEKLCVFLIEKALRKLVAGKEQILGIFDLRGFSTKNADLTYLTFLGQTLSSCGYAQMFCGKFHKQLFQSLVAEKTILLPTMLSSLKKNDRYLGQKQILQAMEVSGFDVFYYYYPKRLGQVLFVEAPFIFKPIWQVAKPLLRSNASLYSLDIKLIDNNLILNLENMGMQNTVRFCSVETTSCSIKTEQRLQSATFSRIARVRKSDGETEVVAIESPQYEVVHVESDFEVRLYVNSTWMSAPVNELSFEKATLFGFHSLDVQWLSENTVTNICQHVSWLDDEDESAILASLLTQSHSSPHFGASHRPQLFQYIQGANLNYSRIAMTAPVVTSIIPGAGPFRSSAYAVRFYLPLKFQADPPAPLDELHLKPYMWSSRCVAVRRFPGYAKDENVAGEAKRLAVSLSRSPWVNSTSTESNYSYSIAQYDSPFHFIGRANEVWADIKAPGANGCESSGIASY
ncbi:hypothetical protein SADUNF_Sadunf15G0070800 [Salix dunnii]|uniref:CRAL-TRIO domain-containing protein n=1 Tax=Salix dunnii TaxID=1413687 RepID=A0A835MNV3_9ROSI|nr:hypothetical protein SADUNF_Sadunf15G0070800 [Salix dunnii]